MQQNKVGFSVGILLGMDVDARLTKLSVCTHGRNLLSLSTENNQRKKFQTERCSEIINHGIFLAINEKLLQKPQLKKLGKSVEQFQQICLKPSRLLLIFDCLSIGERVSFYSKCKLLVLQISSDRVEISFQNLLK